MGVPLSTSRLETTRHIRHHHLQIREGAALIYPEYDWVTNTSERKQYDRRANFKGAETYTGTVTASAAKRIKQAVDVLLAISPWERKWNPPQRKYIKHRLSFITLTIPTQEKLYNATEGYRLFLQIWIKAMQRLGYLKHYIFKFEFQKRGQAHWHITTPDIIPWGAVRQVWNNICRMRGAYQIPEGKHADWDAPSTEVKACKSIDNIRAYLVKYLSKNEQNDKAAGGRIWGCSESIRGQKRFSIIIDDVVTQALLTEVAKLNHEYIEDDNYIMFWAKNWDSTASLGAYRLTKYQPWLDSIKNYKPPDNGNAKRAQQADWLSA